MFISEVRTFECHRNGENLVTVNRFSPQVRTNSNKRDSEISSLGALKKESLLAFACLNDLKELHVISDRIESQYA